MCVSHFPRFSVFLPYYRSYSVCVSFSIFVSFLAIVQVLQCVFLIFSRFHSFSSYPWSYSMCLSFCMFFNVSRHIPIMWFSHFPCLPVFSPYSRFYSAHYSFSTLFSVSQYSRSKSVCIPFSTFFSFITIFQVLYCAFLILHVFHCSLT